MKLQDLKIGDTITHYCSGQIVKGTIKQTLPHVISEHEPVNWGKEIYTKTAILKSSYLQKKWGGTNDKGQPCKGKDVTPGAWYEGKEITV